MRLEWQSALVKEDTRKDHGERRVRALGFIHEQLHGVIFTPRNDKLHVISLRKANNRKIKPKADVTMVRVGIRPSPEVLDHFKASGDDWQTRIDAALRQYISEHPDTC